MARALPAIVYFILAFILGTLLRAFRQYFIQPYIGYHGALMSEAIILLAVIVLAIFMAPRMLAYEKHFGTRMVAVFVVLCCILFAAAAFIDVISFIPVRLRVPVFPLGPVI